MPRDAARVDDERAHLGDAPLSGASSAQPTMRPPRTATTKRDGVEP